MPTHFDRWSYHNPVEIRFDAGRLGELPDLVAGRRALLVTTPGFTSRGLTARVVDLIGHARTIVFDRVQPNPDLLALDRAGQALADQGAEVVVALGGGSAIDTGKALSVLLAAGAPAPLREHLRDGAPLPDRAPLPLVAVPTTAGTGSEVTPFATIWDHERGVKRSLSDARLFARTALLDPALTVSLPAEVTIASGLDALSQAFEAIWNVNATPITSRFALDAIAIVFETLEPLLAHLGSLELRSRMMEASLLAGLAISRTRTALAHSISYPITAHFGVPHGLACSFTLPALLEFNAPLDDGRLAEIAGRLGLVSLSTLHYRLERLLAMLGVTRMLRRYIPSRAALLDLAPQMLTPGRSDNNLRPAGVEQVRAILAATEFCAVLAQSSVI